MSDETAQAQGQPPSLATDLRISLMRTVRRLRAEKADADISDAQYSVLAAIDRLGPRTPSELAEHERVQPPSMTRIVTALVGLGLATRVGHPVDGRQILVELTDAGRQSVRETRHRRNVWLAQRLDDLSADERRVLAAASDILRRIADS